MVSQQLLHHRKIEANSTTPKIQSARSPRAMIAIKVISTISILSTPCFNLFACCFACILGKVSCELPDENVVLAVGVRAIRTRECMTPDKNNSPIISQFWTFGGRHNRSGVYEISWLSQPPAIDENSGKLTNGFPYDVFEGSLYCVAFSCRLSAKI